MRTIFTAISLAIFLLTSCKNESSSLHDAEIKEIESSLITSIQVDGDPSVKYTIEERMDHYKVPGLSIAVIKAGKLRWAKGYGIANNLDHKKVAVTPNTLFQAGSISKPVAALSVLKLVEEGELDLNENVNTYLKNWEIPESKYTKEQKVTLRKILSHTAGLTVHGFPGYTNDESLPSIIQVLNGEGNTPKVILDTIPGSIWRYSGGGYTLMEKVVEDVSGINFEKFMATKILQPLKMTNSTYEQPLPSGLETSASIAYNRRGAAIVGKWHNYSEKAAAGLWTTPTDLAKYCIEVQEILGGKENGLLSKETIELMLTREMERWGLGPALQWGGDSLIFSHGGKNEGFTNELLSFAYKGDGVIIMTNADNGRPLINEILHSISTYYDWGIKKTTKIDPYLTDADQLKKLIGTYKYNGALGPVPDVEGDFLVEVYLNNGKLRMVDRHGYFNWTLVQTKEFEFIEMDEGIEIMFKYDSENIVNSLETYYGFLFDKIE
ncbi:serine hydrolase domain-containing protein [Arthrospiribacter ruber]|uniref:Class A beta-lactamase-related serine hydrolase n=1 Tax=Arthrospiribacter ruber TaxID=2487934 RepID=A0A951IVJ9_9BACT|nr:serine hydrolase domain-containing protein [Arthrospiribacter ruber]MBW3467009.1 class A beta-lactamase-related serine hydrolase [Arthrospiribacter ruber]